MGSDKRTTQPRRQSYHTISNRMKPVKTPGGKLVLHLVKKCSTGPKCGDTGVQLHGIKKMKAREYKSAHKREKTVSRAYGGSLCGSAVRDR
jgi:large subunit ribosomal protein L34e